MCEWPREWPLFTGCKALFVQVLTPNRKPNPHRCKIVHSITQKKLNKHTLFWQCVDNTLLNPTSTRVVCFARVFESMRKISLPDILAYKMKSFLYLNFAHNMIQTLNKSQHFGGVLVHDSDMIYLMKKSRSRGVCKSNCVDMQKTKHLCIISTAVDYLNFQAQNWWIVQTSKQAN